MNIAIVDDALEDRVKFELLIKQYAERNHLPLCASTYETGTQFLLHGDFSQLDVLFLDIYMESLTGLDVAAKLRANNVSCPIIFLTSSQAHAIKSYEVRAFDYILKPITYEKLEKTLTLLQQNKEKDTRFIVVKEGRQLRKIQIAEIDYVDYYNHYTQIHIGDTMIRTYQKFSEFESKMEQHKMFLTCHRCIMVNMDHVEKIEKGSFIMKSGKYVPINRKNAKEVKVQYLHYVFGDINGDFDE